MSQDLNISVELRIPAIEIIIQKQESSISIELTQATEPGIDIEFRNQGPKGPSAYQVAIANGFVGTEEQWLDSLTNAHLISYEAGEQINSHTPVVLIGGKIYKLDNENTLHQFAFVGFSKTSGNTGQQINVSKEIITLQGWGLTANVHYLAGPGGTLRTSVSSGFKKVIGFAQDSNTLLIINSYTTINSN